MLVAFYAGVNLFLPASADGYLHFFIASDGDPLAPVDAFLKALDFAEGNDVLPVHQHDELS